MTMHIYMPGKHPIYAAMTGPHDITRTPDLRHWLNPELQMEAVYAAQRAFTPRDEAFITAGINRAIGLATQRLQLNDVNITVTIDAVASSRDGFIQAAFCCGPRELWLSIDPDNKEFRTYQPWVLKCLSSAASHELNHAKRMDGPGYGMTLDKALVTEGLAVAYEGETGHYTRWVRAALTPAQLLETAEKAERVFAGLEPYDHNHWFIDYKAGGVPELTGYALGLALVNTYLKNNPGMTATSTTQIEASVIMQSWGDMKKDLTADITPPARPHQIIGGRQLQTLRNQLI